PSTAAPFQKFRWLHVPGSRFQALNETKYGMYKYFITPRYWDVANDKLLPLEDTLTLDLDIKVDSFDEEDIYVSFTRGFTTSQAYVARFGENSNIFPPGNELIPDINQVSGTNPKGNKYTFKDQYEWMGFKARERTLTLLDDVLADQALSVEVFAYDLNEPAVMDALLKLAAAGRIRMILDNSTTKKEGQLSGHGTPSSVETKFFNQFNLNKTGNANIIRGRFSRLQHHKVIIVKKNDVPQKVLTGATNFSITGFCVNANHIVIFDSKKVAQKYHEVFEESFSIQKMKAFNTINLSQKSFRFSPPDVPLSIINFAPHDKVRATEILDSIVKRIEKTQKRKDKTKASVLFSVMSLASNVGGNVVPALREIHKDENIFTYGVSDSVKGVSLYKPNRSTGLLINAQSLKNVLPPPFNKEVKIRAHNIHHKFIVLDFNRAGAVVYCGSSNLALGGEQENGDNLIEIRDPEIATVFAIEALRLVDHYHFRANEIQATLNNETIKLKKTNSWAKPYYNKNDIKFKDRNLFC
ncbi:MAG: phospholipase D-like domain-containing protein, partial [Ginsengibacter sp.]